MQFESARNLVKNLTDKLGISEMLEQRPVPPGLRAPVELEGKFPVLGHTVGFVRGTIDLLKQAEAAGEVVSFRVAHLKMVAVFGPEAQEAVFRAPDEVLNPSEAYKIMTPVFGKDIVYDAPPAKMNEQIKMLLPALKDRRMRTYGEIIVEEVEKSIAQWGDSGEIDIVDYCRVLTNFTSSHCLIGSEFRYGMTDEFAGVYHDLERGVTPLAYLNANLPIPSFRKRNQARVRCVEMITELIHERRRSGKEGEDFLQTLMEAKYRSGASLSEDEITGLLLAAMFAGHHTSSVTTAWTLIELCQHPEWMKKVVEQLDEVYGDGRTVGFHSLREISQTEWAVKESLRLHPPLFMLVRTAKEDWVYKDYFIPKGSWVLVSPAIAHLMPEVFHDPELFDPGRYSPEREEDKRDFAWIPFGGGRHKCMGNAFAILQIKAILAILLRRYEFELVEPNVASDFHGLVIGPAQPCRIRYKKRATAGARASDGGGVNGAVHVSTKKYKVVADLDLCQSHAVCMGEAPEVFHVGKTGKVQLKVVEPAPELRAKVERAVAYCPNRVLKIVDLE
ncbi:MAG: cytochrome P450 [Polyangiaceae bacterium]